MYICIGRCASLVKPMVMLYSSKKTGLSSRTIDMENRESCISRSAGYGKAHKDLWKQPSTLPRFEKRAVWFMNSTWSRWSEKLLIDETKKAVAVTFQEGGNLNGKPATKRTNGDSTPSRISVLLSSPMAGNRPRADRNT
jgi:hypothetical protein